jgi:hypothetical protein
MATWKLSPQYKKSAVEKMFFFKDGKIIIMEQGFRWATFSVESDERPLTDAELKNDDYYELGCIDNDECWEMQDMSDGCWMDVTAGNDKTTDEDLAAFNDAWEADWYSGVEAIGWSQDECEYYFYGPLELTNEDTGEVFYGEPQNEPTVQDSPELSFEEKLEIIQEIEEEKSLITEWYPASINPVRIGTYQVLETELEEKWPFVSNVKPAVWDGKKWDNKNVVKWRGLTEEVK